MLSTITGWRALLICTTLRKQALQGSGRAFGFKFRDRGKTPASPNVYCWSTAGDTNKESYVTQVYGNKQMLDV